MKQKILFVDDEPSIRVITQALLESAGYVVECAQDGFEALKSIQRSIPDLIISDLRMPNMNGFEFLSLVRTRYPSIPTIAISGEFVGPKLDPGVLFDAFFQKASYAPRELFTKIDELLKSGRSSRRLRVEEQKAQLWAPTGDAPVMLTCTKCLHSFPIDPCNEAERNQVDCVFCGARVEYQLLALAKETQ